MARTFYVHVLAILCARCAIAQRDHSDLPQPLEAEFVTIQHDPNTFLDFPRPGDPLRKTISPRKTIIFGREETGDRMEAIVNFAMPFNADRTELYNCAFRCSYFPVEGRTQTWSKQYLYNIEDLLPSAECNCQIRIQPGVTSSPDRRMLIFYGFGPDNCTNKIILYDGHTTTSMKSSGGENVPWAFSPALVTIMTSPEEFALISYGGSLCNDVSNPSCLSFSASVWRLTVNTFNKSVGHWTEDKGDTILTPGPRSNPSLFLIDEFSLLLFGGFKSTSNYTRIVLLNDLWVYNMRNSSWNQLVVSGIPPISTSAGHAATYLSFQILLNVVQATYVEELAVLMVAGQVSGSSISFRACQLRSINGNRVHCDEMGNIELPPSIHLPVCTGCPRSNIWYSLMSGSSSNFYLVFNGVTGVEDIHAFTLRRVSEANKNGSLRMFPVCLLQRDLLWRFPGRQQCLTAAPIATFRSSQSTQFIFVGGTCLLSNRRLALNRPGEDSLTSIWNLRIIKRTSGSFMSIVRMWKSTGGPNLAWVIGYTCTSVGDKAICFGGYNATGVGFFQPSYAQITWCYNSKFNNWHSLLVAPGDPVPSARADHVAFSFNTFQMFVQGGGHIDEVFADLWMLQLDVFSPECTGKWHNLTGRITGGHLPRRRGHSVTVHEYYAIFFGGKMKARSMEIGSSLIVLSFKSLQQIVLTSVEFTNPIAPRYAHTLSFYTNDSLLLLGGSYSQGSKGTPSEAQLIQLNANNTVTAIPFFNYTIHNHRIMDNFIFGGIVPDNIAPGLSYLRVKNDKNCPLGYGRTEGDSCQPCAKGYYSDSVPKQCMKCPDDLTTQGTGATLCIASNPCTVQHCHGHGTCFVDSGNKAYCKCRFGYLPDDNCRTPTVYLSQLAAVVFSFVMAMLIAFLVKFARKRGELRRTEEQLQCKHRDLRISERKLDEINRGTRLKWSDLTIGKQIASGAYSKVYLAKFSDMTVVVKQLAKQCTPAKWQTSPYDIFIQEAETLRSLRHPNIVIFLGAGRDTQSGCPFLVMEYLRRGSLYDNLHDAEVVIDHSDRLRFAMDIARGMRYLHSSNPPQVHRDLKSPNLLVSGKWVVKVADVEFVRYLAIVKDEDQAKAKQGGDVASSTKKADARGVCQTPKRASLRTTIAGPMVASSSLSSISQPLLAESPTDEQCDVIRNERTASQLTSRVGMTCGVGTDRWRAPELLKENTYTDKSDVYSYGVVLWEIFTRQLPYSHLTCTDYIHQEILDGNTPVFPPTTPYPYRHLAEECMKDVPRDRPSFVEIIQRIEELQVEETSRSGELPRHAVSRPPTCSAE